MKKINSLLNSLPFQGKEATRGFTLVELIVVITILAILGTIAFISLQGYSKDARDSVRISDISKIKTSLELFQLDAGKYPETTDAFSVTYSGAVAWTQGIFGETTFSSVEKLDKIPTDPVTDRKYVYSVTNTKQEYQIAGVMEGDEVTMNINQPHPSPLLGGEGIEGILKTNAAGKTAMLKISGNYNGKLLKVSTGGTDYVLAVPSIITSSGFTLEQIVASKFLTYNGYKNLPSQYAGSSYEVLGDSGINLVNSTDLVVYSGSLITLSDTTPTGVNARKILIENLQRAYAGTDITSVGEIAEIIDTNKNDSNAVEVLSSTIVNNDLGGNIVLNISKINACATQPEYTGATFEIGVATQPNQLWQSNNASEPCYWTCGAGKVLDENTCVSELCDGTSPDGTAKVSNATSFAGGTWNYNTTPGKCTYSCGILYHTEDNSNCLSNTKSCTLTNGEGEQTWNGTSRGQCIATSCTGGYTGTSCEIAPLTYQQLGLCNEADIVVPAANGYGSYTIASCNIGTTIAGTGPTSYGRLFKWGDNNGRNPTSSLANYIPYINGIAGTQVNSTDFNSTSIGDSIDGGLNRWARPNNLVQGPCPIGYHVPSANDWTGIMMSGGRLFLGAQGTIISSDLKLPWSGYRDSNGNLGGGGTAGVYWTTNPSSTNAYYQLFMNSNLSNPSPQGRNQAMSIRCFKD